MTSHIATKPNFVTVFNERILHSHGTGTCLQGTGGLAILLLCP